MGSTKKLTRRDGSERRREEMAASQEKKKKRENRIKRQLNRHGTEAAALSGWASRQAARRYGRKGRRRAVRGFGRTKGYKFK